MVEVIDEELGGKQASVGSLGIYGKCVSTFEGQRLLRWALQAEVRAIMSDEEVARCFRVPYSATVDLLHDPVHRFAHYGGLVTCGSVWMCPVCAAKISERRRDELSRAILRLNELGYPVFMATYTISHNRFNSLSDLLHAFLAAHRRTKQGRAYQDFKQCFGVIGTIRALEVTWGYGTGWHPHVHELVIVSSCEVDEEAFEVALRRLWESATKVEGLKINKYGFKLDRTRGAVEDYIAKYGREPARMPWGAEAELTKAHIKKGRVDDRFTPFGLLVGCLEGHNELASVFREYATYFKGKRQLQWSQGLKLMLLGEPEKSDEELVSEMREEAVLLGRLTRDEWKVVLANDARGELLEVAHSGDWNLVVEWLSGIGVVF